MDLIINKSALPLLVSALNDKYARHFLMIDTDNKTIILATTNNSFIYCCDGIESIKDKNLKCDECISVTTLKNLIKAGNHLIFSGGVVNCKFSNKKIASALNTAICDTTINKIINKYNLKEGESCLDSKLQKIMSNNLKNGSNKQLRSDNDHYVISAVLNEYALITSIKYK
jgi:hypothetical protein